MVGLYQTVNHSTVYNGLENHKTMPVIRMIHESNYGYDVDCFKAKQLHFCWPKHESWCLDCFEVSKGGVE